jgi:hypothetical protein
MYYVPMKDTEIVICIAEFHCYIYIYTEYFHWFPVQEWISPSNIVSKAKLEMW